MLPPEAQAAKQKRKVKRKVKPAPAPPNFTKQVPVRPGAKTNRYVSKPTTQAQRTHVHKARVARNSLLGAVNQQTALAGATAAAQHARAHPKDLKPVETPMSPEKKYTKYMKLDKQRKEAAAGGALGKLTGINIKKALDNIPGDAAELVTTTPTSVAKLATTSVTHPKKVPGMLVEPYKQLIKDPKTFIENKPVSAALMLSPAARMPGRLIGKGARLAGKQTLERPAATLPGTALKDARVGSKDFTIRKMQARKDAKNPAPTMTVEPGTRLKVIHRPSDVEKRVDHFYGTSERAGQRVRAEVTQSEKRAAKEAKVRFKAERKAARPSQTPRGRKLDDLSKEHDRLTAQFNDFRDLANVPDHVWQAMEDNSQAIQAEGRVAQSAAKEPKVQYKDLSKADREAHVEERVKGALGQHKARTEEQFAKEFGSTWHVKPDGRIVKPTDAKEGVLHDSKAHADAIADRVPFDAAVKKVGEQYAVVPKAAAERLRHHGEVGTSRSTGSKVLRSSRAAFARTVLPTRVGWLTGQATEAGLRTGLMRAGPRSAKLAKRVVAEMDRQEPGSGKAFLDRTIGQGNVSRTARELLSPDVRGKTLAKEFEGTPLHPVAKALTNMGKAPGLKQTRHGWRVATDFVFNKVNGDWIEAKTQNAMLGRALRDSPLLERSILHVSDKAVKEAAEGLKDTAAQHQLAKDVQRGYGKYSNFGPHAREAIAHWTPFIPWYINSVRFLASVLPKDHPVVAAALADAGAATEEWRKKQHVSLKDPKHVPGWMLGNYPTKKGSVKLGHYVPFGIAQGKPSENLAGLVLPQFSTAAGNLVGRDWTGKELKKGGRPFNEKERYLAAGSGLAEAMIPGVAQAGQLSGVIPKYVYGKDVPVGLPSAKQIRKQVNPLEPITSGEEPKKKKVRKKKGGGKISLGGGSGGKIPLGGGGGKKIPLG